VPNKSKASSVQGENQGLNADLQRVLNAAAERVGTWIGERQALAKHLEGIRETATRLLGELGTAASGAAKGAKKSAAPKKRRRSKLSAEGRAAIVAAQKARWAKVRKAKEK
jgi:hypothetical protein